MTTDMPRYAQIFNTLSKRMQAGRYPRRHATADRRRAVRGIQRQPVYRSRSAAPPGRAGHGAAAAGRRQRCRVDDAAGAIRPFAVVAQRPVPVRSRYPLRSAVNNSGHALDERVAEDVGAAAGERWQMVEGLRRHEKDGKAFCYLHSYIAPRAKAYVRELKRCVGPFYAHLANRTGEDILEVRQDIFGTPMSSRIASSPEVQAPIRSRPVLSAATSREWNLDRKLQLARGRAVSLPHENVARDPMTDLERCEIFYLGSGPFTGGLMTWPT